MEEKRGVQGGVLCMGRGKRELWRSVGEVLLNRQEGELGKATWKLGCCWHFHLHILALVSVLGFFVLLNAVVDAPPHGTYSGF